MVAAVAGGAVVGAYAGLDALAASRSPWCWRSALVVVVCCVLMGACWGALLGAALDAAVRS